MADVDYRKLLEQGVPAWNDWRKENPHVRPDLAGVVDFVRFPTNIRDPTDEELRQLVTRDRHALKEFTFATDLSGVDFSDTNLEGATMSHFKLAGANFRGAHLGGVNLSKSILRNADFYDAHLRGACLQDADLRGANLTEAYLLGADLRDAELSGADFTHAHVWETIFGNNDLSQVRGLDQVRHSGPSTIGVDTIYRSKGRIPQAFLRGAGVPEEFIVYMGSMVTNPIEFYSCFISYSSKDRDFAERLHQELQESGVRCWFAPEDLRVGDKFPDRIEESIRLYDKLVLILSESSISSGWVEREVEAALEKEDTTGRLGLFPIRLDDSVMETDSAWASSVRRNRHIGDFRRWKEHDSFKSAFARLLRDLRAESSLRSRTE